MRNRLNHTQNGVRLTKSTSVAEEGHGNSVTKTKLRKKASVARENCPDHFLKISHPFLNQKLRVLICRLATKQQSNQKIVKFIKIGHNVLIAGKSAVGNVIGQDCIRRGLKVGMVKWHTSNWPEEQAKNKECKECKPIFFHETLEFIPPKRKLFRSHKNPYKLSTRSVLWLLSLAWAACGLIHVSRKIYSANHESRECPCRTFRS